MHHDPAAALASAIAAHEAALARQRPGDPAGEAAVELALTRCNALAAAILYAPARTPQEVRAKAAALSWEIEGETDGATFDSFRLDAVRSLLDDLSAMPDCRSKGLEPCDKCAR